VLYVADGVVRLVVWLDPTNMWIAWLQKQEFCTMGPKKWVN